MLHDTSERRFPVDLWTDLTLLLTTCLGKEYLKMEKENNHAEIIVYIFPPEYC